MQQIYAIFSSFFESVEQVSNFKGGVIVNRKGAVVSDCFKDHSQAEKIASITSETLNHSIQLTREGRTGQFNNILLEGTFGKIFIMALHAPGYYAAIVGTNGLNIGMIKAIFEESIGKTSEIDQIN